MSDWAEHERSEYSDLGNLTKMNPLAQIVNEEDEVIGHKPRLEINHAIDIYRVAALWLTNSRGEVLIAQRKMTKQYDPGTWGPAAAGTLEDDDTYETNIYKEAQEEIGLTGVEFELGPKIRRKGKKNYFVQWFVGTCDKDAAEFTPQPEEVEQVCWITKENLLEEVASNPGKFTPSLPTNAAYFLRNT